MANKEVIKIDREMAQDIAFAMGVLYVIPETVANPERCVEIGKYIDKALREKSCEEKPKMEWINKKDTTPKIGQLILVFWPSRIHPVSKQKTGTEVACMRYAESKGIGSMEKGLSWYPEFLWGSGRFGHRSTTYATHWMALPPFPTEEAEDGKVSM